MTPDSMESPLSQIPPADPTPSAAVAPTGGETFTQGDYLRAALALRSMTEGAPRHEVLALADRFQAAALSSPVRAEPTEAVAEGLRKVIRRKVTRSRAQGYEPTMVTVSIAELESLLAAQSPVRAERGEAERLRRHLELAITRLGILRDRMEGCEEMHPDTHRVSLLEVPDWVAEHRAALTPTQPATPTEPGYDKRGKAHGVEVTLDDLPPELRAMVEERRAALAAARASHPEETNG